MVDHQVVVDEQPGAVRGVELEEFAEGDGDVKVRLRICDDQMTRMIVSILRAAARAVAVNCSIAPCQCKLTSKTMPTFES